MESLISIETEVTAPELRPGHEDSFPNTETLAPVPLIPVDPDKEKERFMVLWSAVEGKCRKWHEQIRRTRQDFRAENTGDDQPNVDDEKRVRLTILSDVARHGASILMLAGYKVKVMRYAEDDYDKQLSGMVEKYLRGTVQQIEQRRGFNLRGDLALGVMKDGAAVMRWWYDETLPGIKPVHRESELDSAPLHIPPIDADIVDPTEFFPMVGRRAPFQYIVHKSERTIQEVYDEWGHDAWALSQLQRHFNAITPRSQLTTTYSFMDYWGWAFDGKEWYVENAILFDRKCVIRPFVRMEGYKVLPWSMATAYEDRSESAYELRWLPFTYWARLHVRRAERLLGQLDQIVEDIANTPAIHYMPDSGEGAVIEYGMKKVINLDRSQNEDFIPPSKQYGAAPVDLRYLIQDTLTQAQRAGLPDAIFGMGTGGSGYAFDQAQEGGRLPLVWPRNQLAGAFRQFFAGIMSLIAEHVPLNPIFAVYREESAKHWKPERVQLHGFDLDDWNVMVEWSAELPDDQMRNMARAQGLMQLLSQETLLGDVLGYDDPQMEIDRKLKEMVKFQDPQIAQMAAWDAYRRQGGRPTLSQVEALKIANYLEQEAGRLEAVGYPPEIIEQYLATLIQGIRMSAMGQVPIEQMLGGATQGAMGAQQAGQQSPQPPDPRRDNTLGLPRQVAPGNPPPNAPIGPGAALRQAGNQIEGRPGGGGY